MHRKWRITAAELPGWFTVVALAFVMSMLFIGMTVNYLPLLLEAMHHITRERSVPHDGSLPFMGLLIMSLFLYVLLI